MITKTLRLALLCSLALLSLAACNSEQKKRNRKVVVRNETITPAIAFNNFFLDSNAVEQFLASDSGTYGEFAEDIRDFYRDRNYQYAWFDKNGMGEQALNFKNLLENSVQEYNDSSLYSKKLEKLYQQAADTADGSEPRQQVVQRTELTLTGQFLKFAKLVYKGSDLDISELGWYIPRKKIDLRTILDSALANKNREMNYAPLNPQYAKLNDYLIKLIDLRRKYNWEANPVELTKKAYKVGDSSQNIVRIKQRLFAYGDYATQDTTPVYDEGMVNAVKSFQTRNGLKPDGVIGKAMVNDLNEGLTRRIRQILINMERARWMPPIGDTSYIFVNLPEYKLHVYEGGKVVKEMPVIVGKEGTGTVIFTGAIKTIAFSPYWNIPTSIARNEIEPAIARNPGYLEANNMERTPDGGYRQKPGDRNSLGRVKFLFPNSFSIYLHDTPNKNLFTAQDRMFSHGCVRVAEPQWLAEYLLRGDGEWDAVRIADAMNQTTEKQVALKQSVRVFLGYFTAWVDEQGRLNFRDDIYGHDAKMEAKLFQQPAPQPMKKEEPKNLNREA